MKDILDGRYRLDEKLAEGGFGAIYRATDLVMERPVALKILHRELMADTSLVERFKREANALARLRDAHTITMYDVGLAADGTRYIVMELLRGQSLHVEFAERGPLPWRRVVAIARGVCSSLREAHALGIIHRDLKPANIHLERTTLETDFVKLLDFGIAKLLDTSEIRNPDLTLTGQMIGTFDYMPPEQLIGGGCTGRSDVFSLGVVMYEMIAGRRPFAEAKGPTSLLMAMLAGAPRALATHAAVPAALDELVARMLSRDPEDRPDAEAADALLARIQVDAETLDDDRDEDGDLGLDDAPTWIDSASMTLVGVAAAPTTGGSDLAIGAQLVISTSEVKPSRAMVVMPSNDPAPPTPRFAIGSATEIDPVATRTDAPAFAIRIAAPPPSPARVAQGTTPIVNERWSTSGQAGFVARSVAVATLLFAFGFALALAIGWLG